MVAGAMALLPIIAVKGRVLRIPWLQLASQVHLLCQAYTLVFMTINLGGKSKRSLNSGAISCVVKCSRA